MKVKGCISIHLTSALYTAYFLREEGLLLVAVLELIQELIAFSSEWTRTETCTILRIKKTGLKIGAGAAGEWLRMMVWREHSKPKTRHIAELRGTTQRGRPAFREGKRHSVIVTWSSPTTQGWPSCKAFTVSSNAQMHSSRPRTLSSSVY